MRKRNTEQDFWNRVGPPDKATGCREWLGRKTKKGYGIFCFNWIDQKAHRLAYHFTHSDFDPSLWVCHRCDNPGCCEPAHLFVGTVEENNWDMVEKGRNIPNMGLKFCDVL